MITLRCMTDGKIYGTKPGPVDGISDGYCSWYCAYVGAAIPGDGYSPRMGYRSMMRRRRLAKRRERMAA